MRFLVRRVSASEDGHPCDMAIPGTYTYHDFRTSDDPIKIPYFNGDLDRVQREWYGDGTNHRVVNGRIARSFEGRPCWFVDIASPEQLVALCRRYGAVRVSCEPDSDEPQIVLDEDEY